MIRNSLLALALVTASLASLACSKSDSGPPQSSSGDSKIRIVYIPKNTGNPYFDSTNDGFAQACKETGAEFSTIAPATADATSQIPLIKDQIQRGVNVIAIS